MRRGRSRTCTRPTPVRRRRRFARPRSLTLTFCIFRLIHVCLDWDVRSAFPRRSAHDNVHVLAAVLRASEDPALSRAQMHRIVRGHRAHVEYMRYRDSLDDSDDDDGPPNEDAWLFEDLSILAKLYARLREKEQLIALIFEVSLRCALPQLLGSPDHLDVDHRA